MKKKSLPVHRSPIYTEGFEERQKKDTFKDERMTWYTPSRKWRERERERERENTLLLFVHCFSNTFLCLGVDGGGGIKTLCGMNHLRGGEGHVQERSLKASFILVFFLMRD